MGIQVVAHTSYLGHTGYNNHSKNFFSNLNKYIPTRVRNYTICDDLSYLTKEQHDIIIEQKFDSAPWKAGTPFNPNPDDLKVNIVLNESHHYFFYDHYESPMIAYNVWEATKQIPEYFNRILQYDQFWCPTEWQRQCTIDQGYPAERVKVVPEGLNGNIFKPPTDSKIRDQLCLKYGIPPSAFIFMIFGRWDTRKSTTEMVRSFVETFGNDGNVYLVLSADNPFVMDKFKSTEERLEHYGLESEFIRVLHFPPREEYVQWLQHGDCLLSCSRSEGWNLPLLEAISCGTVTVASDWGGHLEFCDGISHKVNVPKELPPKDLFCLGDGHDIGVWGEPDFEHLNHVMKEVKNDFSTCLNHATKMSKFVRELYTWDNAARKAEGYIKELTKKHYITKEENKRKIFDVKFDITDDNYPKVTFKPLHKKYSVIKVIVRNMNGQILYENTFDALKPRLEYWMTAVTPITQLDGITVQFIDHENNLLQSDTKKYRSDTPKISFVTSFYNAEPFVDELADSVLSQTLGDWEWIITDDWSDDKTKEKVDHLTLLDRRIKYIDQNHKQEVYWNPHKYANGDIVCAIDADDVLVPKTGEVIAHFYERHPEVNCIHVNANYHSEKFVDTSFKHSSFARLDNFDSILQKHIPYLKNESGYERIGQVFGTIRSYRNPGPNFDFNDADYKLGKHEDLVKLLRLEEIGVPLYLNRTLYKVRLREEGSNSGNWKENSGDDEFEKMRAAANNRREKCFRHLHDYDSIREELYAFLYSSLNDESDRKNVACLGFDLTDKQQELVKIMYFDHDIMFETINQDVDYVFGIIRTKNDMEMYEEMVSDLRKAQINFFFINDTWEPDFYDLEDGSNYFKFFSRCKDWLVSKRPFMWTTYLYKYCSIIYDLERKPIKLNLGCGNDIRSEYINIDKYNNTTNVDIISDIGDLPFENGIVDEIFNSHVFEHIPVDKIYGVVEEWRRVLRSGGYLEMFVPDLEADVNAWLNANDDQKWLEVPRIFGSQTNPGFDHVCGFNLGSLKSFIERFDFEVLEIRNQTSRGMDEIYIRSVKKPDSKRVKANYFCHFVDGPFLEIKSPQTNNFFMVDFLDPDNNSSVHQQLMDVNHWTRPHRKYFTNWRLQVHRNGKLDFDHQFNARGKRVLISFDTKSLGDTLAWIPYMQEFKNKHGCELHVSTFWNRLFAPQKQYSDLNWVMPGSVVENLYASYMVGCHDNDRYRNKVNWRAIPLQQVCTDFLGLEYKEIVPKMQLQENRGRKIKEKYVCLSEFSTFQCKLWNVPYGWQDIVDYLNDLDYKVVVISKEATKLERIVNRTNRPINETIDTIRHCEFFLGVSAGPSWLAWTLDKPVVLVSGYSARWGEFKTKIKRVINQDVCHGCFNDPTAPFDRGDWNWCPRQKGTPKQFECTKKITVDMVKRAIDEILTENYDIIDY